jgi:hypothetical protein
VPGIGGMAEAAGNRLVACALGYVIQLTGSNYAPVLAERTTSAIKL